MGALSALHCISEHIGEKDDRFRQLSEERLNFRRFTTSKASEVLGPPSLHSSQPKHKLVHSERNHSRWNGPHKMRREASIKPSPPFALQYRLKAFNKTSITLVHALRRRLTQARLHNLT